FMIIPKHHVDYFYDLPGDEYQEIFELAKKLERPLRNATGAKKIGLVVEGFAVPHAHLHLVPLHKSNDIDPCKAKPGVSHEMKIMAEKIRFELGKEIMRGTKF
ncbi:MAG: HIT domain-containing protein, partial [archaeon]